jgi:hypothetical protein
MEEDKYNGALSDVPEEHKEELTSKLELVNNENELSIDENHNFYYGGIKYIHSLTTKLAEDVKNKFWSKFDITDYIKEVNNVNNLTKILSRSIFNLDVEVEVLHLIVKDYYKRIIDTISR